MVMQTAADMGLKDLTVCASSLGAAHWVVADLIEKGIVKFILGGKASFTIHQDPDKNFKYCVKTRLACARTYTH